MEVIVAYLLIILSVLIRCVGIYSLRAFFKTGFAGDSSVHYMMVKTFKQNFFAKRIDNYVMDTEDLCYPVVFHKISSIFSLNILKKYSWLPNLIYYFFFQILVYIFMSNLNVNSSIVLLYLFLSAFVSSNFNTHAAELAYFKLSERLLSRLITSFLFLCIYFIDELGQYVPHLLIVLLMTLSILSSKFARQVVFFIVPLIAILTFKPFLILDVLLALILCFLISRDYFLLSIKNSVRQWSIYKKYSKKSSIVRSRVRVFKIPQKFSVREFKRCALSEPIYSLLLRSDFFISILCAFILNDTYAFIILSSILALYIATATDLFNHLGECFRYIEYSSTFLSLFIISKYVVISNNYILLTFILLYSVFWGIAFQRREKRRYKNGSDRLSEVLGLLNLKPGTVIFPVTMRLGADIVARGDYKSFWWQPGISSKKVFEEYVEEYPFLKKEYKYLFEKHDVEYIFIDKCDYKMVAWEYDFEKYKPVYEDEMYKVMKV